MKELRFLIALLLVICLCACGGSAKYDDLSLDELLDLGTKYLQEENYKEAVIVFEKAIAIDEKCVDAYIGIADAHIGLKEYGEAKNQLKKAIEKMGNDASLKEKLVLIDKLLNGYVFIPQNAIKGNLEIVDVMYRMEKEADNGERHVFIDAKVIGPDSVRDVTIWQWQNEDYSKEEIDICLQTANETDYYGNSTADNIPFEWSSGFTFNVIEEKNLNVLLIAHNDRMQSVGYAVITIENE